MVIAHPLSSYLTWPLTLWLRRVLPRTTLSMLGCDIILINYGLQTGPNIKLPFFPLLYFCVLILDLDRSWWILEEEGNTREWHIPGNSGTFKAEIKGARGPQRWLGRAKAVLFSSVQFSLVISDSLWTHGQQHARSPCPSPTPRTCSNSCPSSWWCHPIISCPVFPFFSCLQSFPASGSFPMSPFFTLGD